MGVKGVVTVGLLSSKHIDVVKTISKQLGLPVTEDKEGMVKSIISHQEGKCLDCEKNNVKKNPTMIASATGRGGCKNCGQ